MPQVALAKSGKQYPGEYEMPLVISEQEACSQWRRSTNMKYVTKKRDTTNSIMSKARHLDAGGRRVDIVRNFCHNYKKLQK
uniref:Cytoplasmic protein n=1 Tax=Panagrellus redivivus TaxID=6233 RepID=A0A7E4W8X8_PANRE